MTAACVWHPDENMLDTARAGNYDIRTLTGPDRSWVVAGLSAHGYTAEAIGTLLHCSLRLIRQIMAEPMTQVVHYAMTIAAELDAAERRYQTELRACELAEMNAYREAARRKVQRDKLIEAMGKGRQAKLVSR